MRIVENRFLIDDIDDLDPLWPEAVMFDLASDSFSDWRSKESEEDFAGF